MHKTHPGHLSTISGRSPGDSDCLDWVPRIYPFYMHSIPKVMTQQVFPKLRNSSRKLSFLSGFPLLPWPPCWRVELLSPGRGLNCIWSPPALNCWTATARSTLPETPTPPITDPCFCAPMTGCFLSLSHTASHFFICPFPLCGLPFSASSSEISFHLIYPIFCNLVSFKILERDMSPTAAPLPAKDG